MTGAAYTLTAADFADGYFARVDALTGRVTATGIGPGGYEITVVLDEPLCVGCDAPFVGGYCAACDEQLVEVEHLGPGRIAA